MENNSKRYDLEERLIDFAVKILDTGELLPQNFAAKHLGGQLVRSGTSPALNYGEAQAAESKADFLHKMKICLKELRESQICLKIIAKKKYINDTNCQPVLKKCAELVAIFTKSIETASKKS